MSYRRYVTSGFWSINNQLQLMQIISLLCNKEKQTDSYFSLRALYFTYA